MRETSARSRDISFWSGACEIFHNVQSAAAGCADHKYAAGMFDVHLESTVIDKCEVISWCSRLKAKSVVVDFEVRFSDQSRAKYLTSGPAEHDNDKYE